MQYGSLSALSQHLALGSLLEALSREYGGYSLLAHWKQGEFHHDLVVRLESQGALPGPVLVIATNCNGGLKELMCFAEPPDRYALWHARCPENPEFTGGPVDVLAEVRTFHWFDPCELLAVDTRSELKPDCRRRQRGGGYEPLA